MDFEENTPQHEEIIHKVYETPGKKYLQKSLELQTQTDSKKIMQIYLTKEANLGTTLKIIHR